MSNHNYSHAYSDNGFWAKCAGVARSVGRGVLYPALCLGYAMKRPETPMWARATIASALGYFISPVDAVPDLVPFVGYSDDALVLAAAVAAVAAHIDADVKRQAEETLRVLGF